MATNEYLDRADAFTLAAPLAANSGVGPIANDPLIWGLSNSPANCIGLNTETSYTPPGSLVPTGNITVKAIGAFFYPVLGRIGIVGANHAIAPGDMVYASGGTQDATTGILYGFTLTADNVLGWPFGRAMAAVGSGLTVTIPVRIGGR